MSVSRENMKQENVSWSRPTGRRALRQQIQKAEVTVVTTPQQLLDAVEEGGLHIEVRAHLDLTTVTPRDNEGSVKRMLNAVEDGPSDFSNIGNSIRGNCSTQPSAAALGLSGTAGLAYWQAGQCVIVTDVNLIDVYHNLWLNGLYIRHRTTLRTGTQDSDIVFCVSERCNLWMTDVTIQGDGRQDPSHGGLDVSGGQAYGEGLSIIDVSSDVPALLISNGATVNLEGCTISHNIISGAHVNSAVLSVNAVNPDYPYAQQQNTILRLQQCRLSAKSGPERIVAKSTGIFSEFDVAIYSDVEREVLLTEDTKYSSTLDLNQAPASRPGIDASSPWFIGVQQTLAPPESPAAAPPPPSGNNTAAIVGGVVAVVLMCLAAVFCITIRKWRRRSRTQANKDNETGKRDTCDLTQTEMSLLPPPRPDASNDEKMDFLQQQLDSFGAKTPMFDDLLLLGGDNSNRQQGGQAVVQMVVSKTTRQEYAIKFFLSASDFKEESALYRGGGQKGGTFAQFLPQVLHVLSNEEGQVKDTYGHPLPPCIVMERGESLDLWEKRRHPDRNQAFTIMHQLGSRLQELHELGYVHRDLKPGNVMWLPRENRWTIIDFGCVAETGASAKLGFTLTYGAPEVIEAYRRRDRTIVAQEAVDVWSLGVMAFELLTGSRAVSPLEGKNKAMDRIQGFNGLKLPWEGSLTPVMRRQLGVFKDIVLKLLHRDPAERPSIREFCVSCDRVLIGMTSIQA